jgi:hypothetical protein
MSQTVLLFLVTQKLRAKFNAIVGLEVMTFVAQSEIGIKSKLLLDVSVCVYFLFEVYGTK